MPYSKDESKYGSRGSLSCEGGGVGRYLNTFELIRGISSISTDQNGLGLTFIVSPNRNLTQTVPARAGTRFYVGLSSQRISFSPINSIFLYMITTLVQTDFRLELVIVQMYLCLPLRTEII